MGSLDGVKRLLLFADQFEELYTLCHDEAERSLFIAVIAAIAKPVGDRNDLAFIATVRSEFLSAVQSDTRLAQSFRITSEAMEASEKSAPDLLAGFDDIKIKTLADAARMVQPEQCEGLDDRELAARLISGITAASATGPEAPPAFPNDIALLGAMTATQFEEAIVEPARRLGVSFETGLADEIREWVLHGRDALPLMEFALQRLWAPVRRHAALVELRRHGRRERCPGPASRGLFQGASNG